MGLPLFTFLSLLLMFIQCITAHPVHLNATEDSLVERANGCFPASISSLPNPSAGKPARSPSNWWCPLESENGFLGFTYYVEWCQDRDTLARDFTRMRTQFGARYVRMYSWCDWDDGFFDRFVSTAYSSGLGVYATIWFGFDGTDEWMGRRDKIFDFVRKNAYAPYAIRSVDVGSEPLYDWVLEPQQLADQINYVKSVLNPYGIKVSISEMQYGYSVQGDSQMVLDAQDVVHTHQLPFFDQDAKFGSDAGPSVFSSTNWFVSHTNWNRKIIFTQTGWPTNANVWAPNSPNAVASLDSAKAFYQLLDNSCEGLKQITPLGGVGWFWHIWEDAMLDGWGLLDWDGNPKWDFHPRKSC
ncbi:hypothetical protein CPB86DRAFT_776546 [Serendipita vermifera]|nr:hypothetical protein CPB86DRAFT_776546 [Serendipita vermifera]